MSPVTEETLILDPENLESPKLEPIEPQAKTEAQLDKERKYNNYCINFADRIAQWKSAHSKTPHIANNPPIVWDSQFNNYVWMNRNWRRG